MKLGLFFNFMMLRNFREIVNVSLYYHSLDCLKQYCGICINYKKNVSLFKFSPDCTIFNIES